MDVKRILVALNSPNGRDAAFARALTLARTFDAELYLLHAIPGTERFSARAAERLKRTLRMRRRVEAAGVRVQAVEQRGDPAEIIELHANARAVDLIVMGGEARRRWGRDRSAVAERVVRRTRVPTLVVPSDRDDPPSAFRQVLVAVDLSAASMDVLRGAIRLTAHEAERLTVMHAVKAADVEGAQRDLAALLSELPGGVDTTPQVATGPAARAILARAADLHADLVVVGRSRGFSLFGSTALRVLRKNHQALLVIPTAAARRTQPVARQRAA